MTIQTNGRLGQILLYVLGVVVGIGLLVGFSLPAVVEGVWLVAGCLLALVGI